MATFDMTAKATTGVNSNSSAINQGDRGGQKMRMIEAVLDMDILTADKHVYFVCWCGSFESFRRFLANGRY